MKPERRGNSVLLEKKACPIYLKLFRKTQCKLKQNFALKHAVLKSEAQKKCLLCEKVLSSYFAR